MTSHRERREGGRLRDRVAVVTGGTGGIGRATCRALAEEGAKIVVVDLDTKRIEDLVRELEGIAKGNGSRPEFLGLKLDVTSEAEMAEMARATRERFGRIDVLVTCAGILRGPGSLPKPMVEWSLQEWEAVIETNLTGVFLSNRAVLPAMIAQRSGNIVNLSSTSGRRGKAHDSGYSASKFGVIGLSEALAEETRPYGVRVQVILPDAVDTPLWDQNGPIRPEQALGPERVADLILYLVTLPADTVLIGPVIAPFRTRRRVGGTGTPGRKLEGVSELKS